MITTSPPVRAHLIAAILLDLAAHILTGRRLRPACSTAGLHPVCPTTTRRPLPPICVYCAITQARTWYSATAPDTSPALAAEAATLAQAAAERIGLHQLHLTDATDTTATANLHDLARARFRATTAISSRGH